MTIDQALQFYVSCGMAVPKTQHVDRPHTSAGAAPPILVQSAPALEAPTGQQFGADGTAGIQP
jgi:hypothetical protein